ncbi:MAG: DegV family protein [Candidatus Izemoplasmatales bacterium]
MAPYVIITDSCCDLPDSIIKEMEINVIPLTVTIDEISYRNYPDERDIKNKDFYQLLRQEKVSITSQLNPEDHRQAAEPWLQKGFDILSLSFSSALSGTYQSAVIAYKELKEKYPEREIQVIDTLSASLGQGLIVMEAAKMKNEGQTLTQVANWVETNKLRITHLFTVTDLNHLKRGGRLSPGKAFLGTLIQLKPILHVTKEGKLVPIRSARGRRHAINRLLEKLMETIDQPVTNPIYISHGDCLEEANDLAQKIEDLLDVKASLIHTIGPVIGSHSGVGTLAVFFFGSDRVEN